MRRALPIVVAAVFGFFLAASAPHRVHHFFEQVPGSSNDHAPDHEHAGNDRHSHHDDHQNTQPRQQTDCVVLSLAQNAHASLVQPFEFCVRESFSARAAESNVSAAAALNLSPFSQRAPPFSQFS